MDLADAPRSGRPRVAGAVTARAILAALRLDPAEVGFKATTWTVALLARYLSARHRQPIGPRTLRRRMHEAGLWWKRPRHVYHPPDPHRPQKKGGIKRRLKRAAPGEPVLAADETILRLFPPLRQAWGRGASRYACRSPAATPGGRRWGRSTPAPATA